MTFFIDIFHSFIDIVLSLWLLFFQVKDISVMEHPSRGAYAVINVHPGAIINNQRVKFMLIVIPKHQILLSFVVILHVLSFVVIFGGLFMLFVLPKLGYYCYFSFLLSFVVILGSYIWHPSPLHSKNYLPLYFSIFKNPKWIFNIF